MKRENLLKLQSFLKTTFPGSQIGDVKVDEIVADIDEILQDKRDDFAKAALKGLLGSCNGQVYQDVQIAYLAKVSYQFADAMLEARALPEAA
jgi:hypothetical protein